MNRFRPFALSIEDRRNARTFLDRTWTEEYRRARRAKRYTLFLIAAILGALLIVAHLAGCAVAPESQHDAEHQAAIASIDKSMERFRRYADFEQRYREVIGESIHLLSDCKNVSGDEWSSQGCGKRKKMWLAKKKALDAEYDAYKAQYEKGN